MSTRGWPLDWLLSALPGLQQSPVRFDTFMAAALYAPGFGYYQRVRPRVGRDRSADFFTATSVGPFFGELVCAACASLLPDQALGKMIFVEIGAEPSGGILAGIDHPFGDYRTIPLNHSLDIAGEAVVFSNELFDAQPARRLKKSEAGWDECHVEWAEGDLRERWLPLTDVPAAVTLPDVPYGYQLDLPLAARALAASLAILPWTGLFLAFDYGMPWATLSEGSPQGTVRAYRQHRQSSNLLAFPGEQDLTCHVCWDWIRSELTNHGFKDVHVESQEAFFIKRAGGFLAPMLASRAGQFDQRKQALLQLIHPGNMGQKFQVMSARRS